MPHGGLLENVFFLNVSHFEGDHCATTSAELTLTTPPDGDDDGVPDCLEADSVAPKWPPGSQLAIGNGSTPTSVTLAWTPAQDNVGVAHYRLYQNDVAVSEVGGSVNSTTISGLSPSLSYVFRVQAVDAAGNTSVGDPTVALSSDTAAPTWPPNSNLSIDSGNDRTMATLSWTPAEDNEGLAHYRVFQDDALVTEVDGSLTSVLAQGLNPSLSYVFRVQAIDLAGNTSSGDPTAIRAGDTQPPGWPAPSLVLTLGADRTATLSWTAAIDNVAVIGYRLYEDGIAIGSVEGSARSFTTQAQLGGLHVFQVEAFDVAGNESVDGPTATLRVDLTAPSWPSDAALTVTVTGTTADLRWTPASDDVGVVGYRVFRDGVQVQDVDGATLRTSVGELEPQTSYTFEVEALDAAGNTSTNGPTTHIRLGGSSPTWPAGSSLHAGAVEDDVALSWSSAVDDIGVAGYRLYRDGVLIAEMGAGTFSRNVTGLVSGTTYLFAVQAFDADGNESTDGPAVSVAYGSPLWIDGASLVLRPHAADGTLRLTWDSVLPFGTISGFRLTLDGTRETIVSAATFTFIFTDVALGAHHAEVRFLDNAGNPSTPLVADTFVENIPPVRPAGATLSASPNGLLNSLALHWTPATDNIAVTGYRVYQNGAALVDVTGLTTNVSAPAASADFRVEAFDANGNLSTGGPTTSIVVDRVKPIWPPGTLVAATALPPNSAMVSWTPATDASGIFRYSISVNGLVKTTVSGAVTTAILSDLSPQQTYTISIQAQDSSGNVSSGDPSVVLQADGTAPVWPTGANLVAEQVDASTAALSWTPATDNVAVAVYRVLDDDAPVADVPGGIHFCEISSLGTEPNHRFQIVAIDARGNSALGPSTVLSFDQNAPSWPAGSAITVVPGDTSARLSWTPATDDVEVDGYVLLLDGTEVAAVFAPSTSDEVFDLSPSSDHSVEIEAFDRAGHVSMGGPTATFRTMVVPPPLNPPPLDPHVVSILYKGSVFLYTGENPVQRGVLSGTIVNERAALVRGQVHAVDGGPLSSVTVSVLHHPEYGETETRNDGSFSLAVNGGEPLILVYFRPDFFVAQRRVEVRWKEAVAAPDVILVAPDHEVTEIQSESGVPQVAQGSAQTDVDGTRRATLIFPSQLNASMVFSDGSSAPLPTFHVRATEYTVGANGPRAMPAPPVGASVAASRIADALRAFGGRGAASASADALNLAEAVGIGADAFVTADRQILRAFGGTSVIPGTGGLSIMVFGF